ncbi:hypothetical protein G7062_02970 [Erysipelothrix sp. HDW6C]|uniref:hypothetical protein n=1 Tax=Erysipelothrix sp. HDW6C TaxID=2714930 RepID=UPI00140E3CA7|nr:hypothetical protein [Erysipelothrix sp. HDW6C]QIK69317.1 hypothetical protein G7062_02970 [Erysipelothrix sp. HDW6C]
MKRHWTALFVVIAAGIIYNLMERFVPVGWGWLLTFTWMVILLVLGYFLSPNSKRNNRWLGKVILSIIIVLIFGYRLDLFAATEFRSMLSLVGLTGNFLDLILIYCGWAFFQV